MPPDFLGWVCLAPFPDLGDIEIGYRLPQAHWGAGLATEAARAVLAHGFAAVGLPRIIGVARTANHRSCRVLEKIGLVHERDFDHRGHRVRLYAGTAAGRR